MHYISPRYTEDDFPFPLGIDNAITIYEDQVHGWFLDVCRRLTDDIVNDFVVLMVIASYFESIAIFYKGRETEVGESRTFFQDGFFKVTQLMLTHDGAIPDAVPVSRQSSDEISAELYEQMRCGFFHTGMTRSGIQITRDLEANEPFRVETMPDGSRYYKFNIPVFLQLIVFHFRSYLKELRDPENSVSRENFRMAWNSRVKRADNTSGDLSIPGPWFFFWQWSWCDYSAVVC